MSFWTSLASQMPMGTRRCSRARLTLTQAYRNLFDGRAAKREAQMVLADLANHSGFYQVLPPGAGPSELAEANGKRAVFGRLFRFLRLSEEEVRALEEAARQEALADAREGEL